MEASDDPVELCECCFGICLGRCGDLILWWNRPAYSLPSHPHSLSTFRTTSSQIPGRYVMNPRLLRVASLGMSRLGLTPLSTTSAKFEDNPRLVTLVRWSHQDAWPMPSFRSPKFKAPSPAALSSSSFVWRGLSTTSGNPAVLSPRFVPLLAPHLQYC